MPDRLALVWAYAVRLTCIARDSVAVRGNLIRRVADQLGAGFGSRARDLPKLPRQQVASP